MIGLSISVKSLLQNNPALAQCEIRKANRPGAMMILLRFKNIRRNIFYMVNSENLN
jgi:hypothetical protein